MGREVVLIAGLDLGTNCGWALSDGRSGTWDLSGTRSAEGAGMRFVRFGKHLEETCSDCDLIAFEDVRRHGPKAGVQASHVYGGLKAMLMQWCEHKAIPYIGYPPAEIKKHAVDRGNAKKNEMVCAARQKWSHYTSGDDNEADALWTMSLAQEQWSR